MIFVHDRRAIVAAALLGLVSALPAAAVADPTVEDKLQLNPRHRGAHEYAGEAYLMVNDLAKAEEHLGALRTICLIPCEEYEDLKKAIADYRRKAAK